MNNTPNKVQSPDAELPYDTVLNPGMIMMRDDYLNPFDLQEETSQLNNDPKHP
jgi:hypothetical protein